MVFVNPWLMFINKHDSGNAQHDLESIVVKFLVQKDAKKYKYDKYV